jgi:hypothetical protein
MAVITLASLVLSTTRAGLSVDYDRTRPLHVVDEQYVNYNIDTGSLYNGMVWRRRLPARSLGDRLPRDRLRAA